MKIEYPLPPARLSWISLGASRGFKNHFESRGPSLELTTLPSKDFISLVENAPFFPNKVRIILQEFPRSKSTSRNTEI